MISHTSLTWCAKWLWNTFWIEAEIASSIHIIQQFTFGITLLKCDMSLNILLHHSPHTYTNNTYIEPWQCYTDVNLRHSEYNRTMYTNRTDGNFNLQNIVQSEFWIQLYSSTMEYMLVIYLCRVTSVLLYCKYILLPDVILN